MNQSHVSYNGKMLDLARESMPSPATPASATWRWLRPLAGFALELAILTPLFFFLILGVQHAQSALWLAGHNQQAEAATLAAGGPDQPRRLEIPRIAVDHNIVPGDNEEMLKRGVGMFGGSVLPGEKGNLILSAHNDVYGAIFRDLDQLEPGDEILVTTSRARYTYHVLSSTIVEPTDTWVTLPTGRPTVTLITCYPRRINDRRLVVFAELVDEHTFPTPTLLAVGPIR